MSQDSLFSSAFSNLDLLEEMYERYCRDPSSVDSAWKKYFDRLDAEEFSSQSAPLGMQAVAPQKEGALLAHQVLRITKLINAYRSYGHLLAKINPIATAPIEEPDQLKIETLGFQPQEMTEYFPTCGLLKEEKAPLEEIIALLKQIYCGNIGVEYMGVQNPRLEEWLEAKIETTRFKIKLTIEQKKMILQHLNRSELFENFLHTKYVGQKRFSLEGGETLIPILAAVIESGADFGLEEFVIGMAHRGRLNVLSNILNKSYSHIFSEFEDRWIADSFEGSGDVKYHKGYSSVISTHSGKSIRVSLAPNPSHLEAVNPVVEGQVRAKQDKLKSSVAKKHIVPILIHGDAAIAGQGIIYETMQMYDLDGYSTGGTIHIVINNQIGFTTLPKEGRSTFYCTDIARAFCAPVFHVNAEDPESCVYASLLAAEIRHKFHCDVFIDLNCYRKYGHNESDEPAYTQPLAYRLIRQKKPIREIYRDDLIRQGILERAMAEALEVEYKASLQKAHEGTRYPNNEELQPQNSQQPQISSKEPEREMLRQIDTGVDREILSELGKKICLIPENFTLHKKLNQLMEERIAMATGARPIDWGMGELLGYASLLREKRDVRLAGQDCGRGTFSHRHAIWMDQTTAEPYCSLKHLQSEQGNFEVINSLLSEYAALGFEYGYSLGNPEALVLWEAQFGDFANGAQVIIDQFIASSEQKWGQKNNVVMLLPHGYEGQGPEHSSARIERFLTLAANDNMFIVYPSTPAQMFHLLRRQVLRRSAKPLIVFTPKALLRLPACVSTIDDFTHGGFQEVIGDPAAPQEVQQLVFCSGKVYYDLIAEREKKEAGKLAIVRIEQLYPLHEEKIMEQIRSYPNCSAYFWIQEEPRNKGPWRNIRGELQGLLPQGKVLKFIGREASAASATGSHSRHKREYEQFIDELFSPKG